MDEGRGESTGNTVFIPSPASAYTRHEAEFNSSGHGDLNWLSGRRPSMGWPESASCPIGQPPRVGPGGDRELSGECYGFSVRAASGRPASAH